MAGRTVLRVLAGRWTPTATKSGKPLPYRCRDCKKYFTVRTGTVMARSHISLQNWAFAIYLEVTSLKGVSSMRLHRDLGISQKAAWFMLHRIRETWTQNVPNFVGPVEIDERSSAGSKRTSTRTRSCAPVGARLARRWWSASRTGRPTRCAAHVVENNDKPTLHAFAIGHTAKGTTIYTDEHGSYKGLPKHVTVKHGIGEYVRDMAHTNGVESFWALLKRGYHGTYHHMSVKHLQRSRERVCRAARHPSAGHLRPDVRGGGGLHRQAAHVPRPHRQVTFVLTRKAGLVF